MDPRPHARASDRKEFLAPVQDDFVTRKRTFKNPRLFYLLFAVTLAVAALLYVYGHSPIGSAIALVIGFIAVAYALHAERLKRMLQATEFLSALFSSALGSNYRFCLITTMTGDIVFSNRPFQSLYPEFSNRRSCKLADLFVLAHMPPEHSAQLLAVVKERGEFSLETRIVTPKGESQEVTLEVEPIERPAGFVLVRAK